MGFGHEAKIWAMCLSVCVLVLEAGIRGSKLGGPGGGTKEEEQKFLHM